jgi:hypothetical protein
MSILTMLRIEERSAFGREELYACVRAHPDDLDGCVSHAPGIRALTDGLDAALRAGKTPSHSSPRRAPGSRSSRRAIWLGLAHGKILLSPSSLPPTLRVLLGV